jgi:hypothetical protein
VEGGTQGQPADGGGGKRRDAFDDQQREGRSAVAQRLHRAPASEAEADCAGSQKPRPQAMLESGAEAVDPQREDSQRDRQPPGVRAARAEQARRLRGTHAGEREEDGGENGGVHGDGESETPLIDDCRLLILDC